MLCWKRKPVAVSVLVRQGYHCFDQNQTRISVRTKPLEIEAFCEEGLLLGHSYAGANAFCGFSVIRGDLPTGLGPGIAFTRTGGLRHSSVVPVR